MQKENEIDCGELTCFKWLIILFFEMVCTNGKRIKVAGFLIFTYTYFDFRNLYIILKYAGIKERAEWVLQGKGVQSSYNLNVCVCVKGEGLLFLLLKFLEVKTMLKEICLQNCQNIQKYLMQCYYRNCPFLISLIDSFSCKKFTLFVLDAELVVNFFEFHH